MERLRLRIAALSSLAVLAIACSHETSDDASSADVASGVALAGDAPLFPGFAYDTGPMPNAGPARLSLKASAGGSLRLSARGAPVAEPGSGRLAIDLHAKLEGHLKVSSPLASYDGDIPGLSNVDIAATDEAAFDPYVLGDGESVLATAKVPETKLPDIPLSGVPGKLALTIREGTTVTAKLHGTCVRGQGGVATFTGATTTSGTIVLRATLKLDLPAPLDKAIDLPDVTIALPETNGTLDAKSDAAEVADFANGACAGTTDTTKSEPTPEPAPKCGDLHLASAGAFVTIERLPEGTPPEPKGGAIADGLYTLLSARSYSAPQIDDAPIKRTMKLAGGTFEIAGETAGKDAVMHWGGGFLTSGTTFTRSFVCPSQHEDAPSYTATATAITLSFPDGAVYTYGKM